MTSHLRSQVGSGLSAALLAYAVVRSGAAGPPQRADGMGEVKQRAYFADIEGHEKEDRFKGIKKFRYSRWSAEDDFFATQAKRVRDYARMHHYSVTALLDAIDVGLHEHWTNDGDVVPVNTVSPCRPRLSY